MILTYGTRPDELPDARPSVTNHQPQELDGLDVVSRLERIESLLRQVTSPRDHVSFATGALGIFHDEDQHLIPSPRSLDESLALARPAHAPNFTIGFDLSGLSRLSNQESPEELLPLRNDNFERLLDLQLCHDGDIFRGGFVELESLDLGRRRCWQLLQFFLKDVLPWCPIIDQADCSDIVSRTVESGFDAQSLDTCLVLFILAVGSFAQDSLHLEDDPSMFPGVGYFRAACQIVDADRLNTNTIRYVQCQILMSFYLLYCLRPLLAHEAIQKASMKVIVLLQLHSRLQADPVYRQQCLRAYWTCYLIEHELQIYIPWSSQILQGFNEDMALPLSDYDEPGIYWFLAEITFRRIFSRPGGCLGWNQMFVICEPVVAREVSQQLSFWHAGLPHPIKFHLDERPHMRPLLDPHKVFLRAQYYAIQATIFWPYVIRMLTSPPPYDLPIPTPPAAAAAGAPEEEEAYRIEGLARKSLSFAVLHQYAVEPLMQNRHLLLLADLTGLGSISMLLLCAYGVDRLRSIQPEAMDEAILIGYKCLRVWEANPELNARAEKMERLMRAKGIGDFV